MYFPILSSLLKLIGFFLTVCVGINFGDIPRGLQHPRDVPSVDPSTLGWKTLYALTSLKYCYNPPLKRTKTVKWQNIKKLPSLKQTSKPIKKMVFWIRLQTEMQASQTIPGKPMKDTVPLDYTLILSEIHLVEEIPDQDADGAVRHLYCAWLPAAPLRWLWVPLAVCLLHCHAWRHVLHPLCPLLHQRLPHKQESENETRINCWHCICKYSSSRLSRKVKNLNKPSWHPNMCLSRKFWLLIK